MRINTWPLYLPLHPLLAIEELCRQETVCDTVCKLSRFLHRPTVNWRCHFQCAQVYITYRKDSFFGLTSNLCPSLNVGRLHELSKMLMIVLITYPNVLESEAYNYIH
jgi:hypothetical protein